MRKHTTSLHGDIPFTAEEEAFADAEDIKYLAEKPMEDWKASMQGTDGGMPRVVEDILDGMANKLSVPQITLDRLQAKKDLRATKP